MESVRPVGVYSRAPKLQRNCHKLSQKFAVFLSPTRWLLCVHYISIGYGNDFLRYRRIKITRISHSRNTPVRLQLCRKFIHFSFATTLLKRKKLFQTLFQTLWPIFIISRICHVLWPISLEQKAMAA